MYHKYEPDTVLTHALLLFVAPWVLGSTIARPFSATFLSVAYTFTVYWTEIIVLTVAYRLSPLHPLAKYPGPALAKASKLWMARASATKKAYQVVEGLHRQYGEVVRIGMLLG